MLLLSGLTGWSQTNEEIRERADKLFEKEQYVSATKDYLHLLSLEPLDHTLNFKYGACLLYNSNQKSQGLRYLNYAVQSETIDPRAYYFRGRALHLNYQFEEAKRDYIKYRTLTGGKKDKRYRVDRSIQMCDNGKRLLTTFTDIIVAEKKEIDQDKFFKIYSDRNTIGGDILVAEQFQSKLDKKLGHVPVVHFPPNAKAIYYSSYGEDESTGLDIYIRRRLPDGKWGDPQLLPGSVNTNEDEDYPYMHPSGKYLYFSSTGHNSMGGYDVFMSRFDEKTNSFGEPENVDFAISSPDDDLFYVVDSLFQNAYFASARQSQDGKLHVYKVKVARVPIQEIIVMGDFMDEINPDNKDMTIDLIAHSNGEEVGKVKSNKTGKYSFVFPQGGKYEYLIDVEGSEAQYKFIIDLPFLDEFRPLKQKIVHKTEDGQEIVKVVNLFDESVEGADAMIAEVIRKKSELNVNIDQFDLEKLEAEKKQKELIASLGFGDMTPREVGTQLNELVEDVESNSETNERVQSNLDNEILAKAERINELNKIEAELHDKANQATDPTVKYKLLNEAEKKAYEKNILISTVKELNEMSDEVADNSGLSPDQAAKLKETAEQFNKLVEEGNTDEAMALLGENVELIASADSGSAEEMLKTYIRRSGEVKGKLKKQQDQELEYDRTIEQLRLEITTMEGKLINTNKKKEVEELKRKITSRKEELQLVEEERDRTRNKINELNKELSVVENQISSLQNAIETEQVFAVNDTELKEAIEEVEQIDTEDHVDYEQEIAQLVDQYPELTGTSPVETTETAINTIQGEQESEKEAIQSDNSLSELEKIYRETEVNDRAIDQVEERLTQVEEELKGDPDNQDLIKEQEELTEYRSDLVTQNETLSEEADRVKSETPDAALTVEDLAKEIDPDYEERVQAIENDGSLNEKERLENVLQAQEVYLEDVTKEEAFIKSELEKDPENSELLAKSEMIKEIKAGVNKDIERTEQAITAIETEVIPAVTEIAINDIDPKYESQVEDISQNESLTPLEKEQQLQELDKGLVADIEEEKKKVEKKLKKDPEDTELNQQLTALNALEDQINDQIAERNQTIAAMEGGTPEGPTTEEVLTSIDPGYEESIASIRENENLTEIEKEEQLKERDKDLLEAIEKEKKQVEKELKKDPDNSGLQTQLETINNLSGDVEQRIAEHDQAIAALEETPEVSEVKAEDILAEIDPEYSVKAGELEAASGNSPKRRIELLQLDKEVLDKLEEKKATLQSELEADPENKSLKEELAVVKQLIEDITSHSLTVKQVHVNELTEDEMVSVIDNADNTYIKEIKEIRETGNTEEEIKREIELQENLQDRLNEIEKELKNKYSVLVDLDRMETERAIAESMVRQEALESGQPEVSENKEKEEQFLSELRSEVKDPEMLTKEYSTAEDLTKQDEQLEIYETILKDRINELENDPELSDNEEKQAELEWTKEELDRVEQKRRTVKISLGELETVTEVRDVNTDQELNSLQKEEADLEEKLADENLTASERKVVEKELKQNQKEQVSRENEIYEEVDTQQQKEIEAEIAALNDLGAQEGNERAEKTVSFIENEQDQIETLRKEADGARSDEEKNYILNEINERQEQLIQTAKDVQEEIAIADLENDNDVQIKTQEELETQKRRFVIRIGELNKEIVKKDEEIANAKKKDVPQLEAEKEALINEKNLVEQRLAIVDEQLEDYHDSAPVVSKDALKEVITFNEEREVASSEEYKTYEAAASEALAVEDQIANLEEELRVEQQTITSLVNERGADDPEVKLHVDKAKEIQAEIDKQNIELVQKKYNAEELLPDNEDEAMKMQNLALRGVKPLQKTVVAAALMSMPASGFSIDTSSAGIYTEENPIPVGVENPSGLFYRVQVGAFAKPIPQDLFGSFTPVSGEKIGGTNITRYMAGFFNNSSDVVSAREQIRDLGYSDAFVVAYCDGERIAFWQARKHEQEGTCLAKGSNELMIEVAENTAEKMGVPLEGEVAEVSELDYAKAPGAADTDPIEGMEGLFFTVQIGVFNRPVGEEHLHGMTEILTIRLPNGQIRYASGMFDSVADALPRRDKALMNGVQGAFVTAYYKGERIPLSKAKKLLADMGPSILQSNIEKEKEKEIEVEPVDTVTVTEVPRTDTVTTYNVVPRESEVEELRVQVVSKKEFEEYPRDVLNRYNAEGSFYYDEEDKHVKSVIYKNADYLPRLWNFREDIDTVYIPAGEMADEQTKIIELNFSDSIIPGDLMDWLLRFNYRREFVQDNQGVVVRIFGVQEEIMNGILNVIRGFGVEPVVREETELELELEENED